MPIFTLIHTQFMDVIPYPDTDFSGKTIIVTGANIGLGKEAVKHFVRLNAEKVIVAVRSIAKGEAAKSEIEAETKRTGVVDVWGLDYSSYASVKAFAAKVAKLSRVDAVVLNAGIATANFELFEDNESTITVNVVSTTLLALLLLPTLRTYPVSKLLQLFAVREIADRTANKKPLVIINAVNPGLCHTSLSRSATGVSFIVMTVLKTLLARSAEKGSRTLVHGTTVGPESHGIYISGCLVKNNALGEFVTSPEGQKAQKKVWGELVVKLEDICPGITKGL
ncbi:MAG: hypothetical protein M1834_005982 [Cirrosporium novae-zelandiae]|nr:MAG: hypothetical protein M1834_005982 [Cirrosporium novae-zelandiae]